MTPSHRSPTPRCPASRTRAGFARADVLALQRSIGNGAVGRILSREVRIDGGKQRVNEAHYKTGKGKDKGIRHKISSLIDDPVRRVFAGTGELENYADGISDYIGDVVTQAAGTFWFRLPVSQLRSSARSITTRRATSRM